MLFFTVKTDLSQRLTDVLNTIKYDGKRAENHTLMDSDTSSSSFECLEALPNSTEQPSSALPTSVINQSVVEANDLVSTYSDTQSLIPNVHEGGIASDLLTEQADANESIGKSSRDFSEEDISDDDSGSDLELDPNWRYQLSQPASCSEVEAFFQENATEFTSDSSDTESEQMGEYDLVQAQARASIPSRPQSSYGYRSTSHRNGVSSEGMEHQLPKLVMPDGDSLSDSDLDDVQ